MQACQIIAHGKPLEFRKVPKPVPTGYQVLARTTVTGVCHTDAHVAAGDWGHLQLPLTPGHEGIGIIESIGPNVTTMKVGDRIGVAWLGVSCMNCYLCKTGRENMCQKQKQTGYVTDGSFAEYFTADERFSARIPDNISDDEAAPILCAGVTAYGAIRVANIENQGGRIVISGACGGLGHMAIQYAKAMGYEVVALDFFDDAKRKMMKALDVNFLVNIAQEDVSIMDQFKSIKPNKPIEASIIFAPALEAVSSAIEYVSPGATIVTVGIPKGEFKIDAVQFILKGLRLQASIVGTPRTLKDAFKYVASGKVKAHVVEKPFNAVNEVLKDLTQGNVHGRVVLRVSKSN